MNEDNEKLEEAYDEMIDECFEPFVLGELTFYPSDILKKLDPIAYRIGLNEYEMELEGDE